MYIKIDTMEFDEIQRKIINYSSTTKPLTSEQIWIKIDKPNKNKFYKILHEMIEDDFLKRTKKGILKIDFKNNNPIIPESIPNHLEEWCKESLKEIKKRHNPLMKILEDDTYSMTKLANEDLSTYVEECDYYILNILNRNYLAYSLGLITQEKYEKNFRKIKKRTEFMIDSLLNDHKQFRKQLVDYFQSHIHKSQFKV